MLLLLPGVSAMHGGAVLALPRPIEPLHLAVTFVLALTAALFLPNSFQGTSVLSTVRFELLPYPPRLYFLLRLAFMQPLRVLLALSACGWTAVGSALAAGPPLHAPLAFAQLLTLGFALLLLVQLLDDALLRRNAIVVHGSLALPAAAAVLVLLQYSTVAEAVMRLWGAHAIAHSAVLPGSRSGAVAELGVLAAAAAGLVAVALLTRSRTAAAAAPPKPPPQPFLFAAGAGAMARVLAPHAPAAFAKELAAIVRHGRIAGSLLWPFLLALLAFARAYPLLLSAAYGLWALQTFNSLGPDVPVSGLRRYELLPLPMGRTLFLRHMAVLTLVTLAVLLAALAVALTAGVAVPPVRPAPHALYFLAALHGATLYLAATLVGDRLSLQYPNWYDLRLRSRTGQQVPALPTLGAIMLLAVLLAAPLLAGGFLTALLVPHVVDARAALVLLTASMIQLLLYAGARRFTGAAR